MNTLLIIFTTPITYVEIAMLLFLCVFIGVLVREIARSRQDAVRYASLPLEDDDIPTTKEESR